MSYDISLIGSTGEPVPVQKFEEGGTYVVGGNDVAHLNVTYNYSWFFYFLLDKKDGIRWLYGKTGREAVPRLKKAVRLLGDTPHHHEDETPRPIDTTGMHVVGGKAFYRANGGYWCATPGNAGHALGILLKWAKLYPDAVFEGD